MLDFLKVLDFTGLLPGPYATMMLADMGADVLRVESPTRPDLLRLTPPMVGEDSAAYLYLNGSKRSITLDLKKSESLDLIKQLVKQYDIVIEQFRPGVMDRLGLGYEALKEVNPRVIYCSLTGYGQSGPFRDHPGHDINYLSIAGVSGYSGRKDGGPMPLGIQVADVAGGSLHAVIGILAAVAYREKTDEGKYIDISMTDASFSLNAFYGSGYLACGVEPEPEAMLLNGGWFYDYYKTKDDRFFSAGGLEPQFRKALCEAIGRADLIQLSMSDNPEDVRMFKEAVQSAFTSKTYDEWLAICQEFPDACVEPVLKFSEACEHPQIKAREMVVEVPNPDGTVSKRIAFPIKFSRYSPEYKQVGGKQGVNNREVMLELGLTLQDIEKLSSKGVFG